jgi:hypothetical protein
MVPVENSAARGAFSGAAAESPWGARAVKRRKPKRESPLPPEAMLLPDLPAAVFRVSLITP